MSKVYAPRQFIRLAANALLKDYFTVHGELAGVEWDTLMETDADPVFAGWLALPEERQEKVEQDFRCIFDLASADGIRTIVDEARCSQLDITAELDARDGFLNKSFWVFLNHRDLFDRVSLLDHADHLSGRYWRARKDLPRKQPDLSIQAIKELGDAVGAYFRENQGRGRWCRAEHYVRANGCHYFFVYPKDYTDTFVGYDDAGRFERRRQNPVFQIVFLYESDDGTLSLYAQGDKKLRRDLQMLFARAILHEEIGEENRCSIPYDLNGLKNRAFAFPTDPADGIAEVRLRELRLSVVGNEKKRITFEVPPKGSPGDVHDLLEQALHEERLPLAMVNVTSAAIQMRFNNTNGNGRAVKTVTFRMAAPDSCTLKDSPHHLIAKKYLKRWELERA